VLAFYFHAFGWLSCNCITVTHIHAHSHAHVRTNGVMHDERARERKRERERERERETRAGSLTFHIAREMRVTPVALHKNAFATVRGMVAGNSLKYASPFQIGESI